MAEIITMCDANSRLLKRRLSAVITDLCKIENLLDSAPELATDMMFGVSDRLGDVKHDMMDFTLDQINCG